MAIPSLAMIPSGYKDGKVYSVLPTNGDGDFTFSRGSNATRVNKDGLIELMPLETSDTELVTNGSFDTDSDWTKDTGWSISGGKASNSLSGDGHNLYQGSVTSVGVNFKVVITTTITAGSVNVMLGGGTGGYNTIGEATTSGTFTYYGVSNGTDNRILFQTGSGTTVGSISIDNVSVKEVISGLDLPRLDYSDSSCPSLLLEPQSTNLIEYSEDFNNSDWTEFNSTVTSNSIISPDGTLNATKLTEDTSNSTHRIYDTIIVSGTGVAYTQSVFAKSGGNGRYLRMFRGSPTYNYAAFNLDNGTVAESGGSNLISAKVEEYPNGWYKCSSTFTTQFSSIASYYGIQDGGSDSYTGDGTSSIYIWGAQLEEQSYPTSYIPTNGAIATRLADVCTDAGNDQVINSSEGVLYAEIAALADDSEIDGISISDGTGTNRVVIFKWSASNTMRVRVTSGGTNTLNQSFTVPDITSFKKIAIKYKLNDFAIWLNGSEVFTDTSGAVPSGLNVLAFSSVGSGGADFYGNVKDLRVYNTALTDAELEELTTL